MLHALLWVMFIILVLIVAALFALNRCDDSGSHEGVHGGGPFRLKVSDPEYTALLEGKKTIEARLDRAPFNKLSAHDPVVVVRSRPQGDTSEYPGGKYKFDAEVVRVKKHKDLAALLKEEGINKVYPGRTAADAAERFNKYLPPGTDASHAVLSIELKPSTHAKAAKKHGGYHSDSDSDSDSDYDHDYGRHAHSHRHHDDY